MNVFFLLVCQIKITLGFISFIGVTLIIAKKITFYNKKYVFFKFFQFTV